MITKEERIELEQMKDDVLYVEAKLVIAIKDLKADVDKLSFLRNKIFNLLNQDRANVVFD